MTDNVIKLEDSAAADLRAVEKRKQKKHEVYLENIEKNRWKYQIAEDITEWKWFHRVSDDDRMGEWRVYDEDGYWRLIDSLVVEKKVREYLQSINIFTLQNFHLAMKIIKTENFVDPSDYDKPGMYLIKGKDVVEYGVGIRPFHEGDKFTRIVPRFIEPVDPISKIIIEQIFFEIPEESDSCEKVYKTPLENCLQLEQSKILKQWFVNMVNCDIDDRMTLFLVGYPSSAKTPIGAAILKMMDGISTTFKFEKIGDNGGLGNVVKKNASVLVQNEGRSGFFNKDSCAMFKEIQSNFPQMDIRLLYHDLQTFALHLFMCVCSNQLPILDDNFENDSLYKRMCILFCPNKFNKCLALEDMLQSDEFINQLWNYCINLKCSPLKPNAWSEEMWWKRNEFLYQWSSRPLQWIIEQYYELSFDFDVDKDGGEVEPSIQVIEIIKLLGMEYKKRQLEFPKQIRDKIKTQFERMGAAYHRNTRNGDKIMGIHRKGIIVIEDDCVEVIYNSV